MSTETSYLRIIAQRILLEMLRDGIVPTPEALTGLTRSIVGTKDINLPILAQPKPTIAYGEAASASKFNSIIGTIVDDLDALYDTALSSEKEIAEETTRTMAELNKIEREVRSLVDRISRLLLVTEQTEGLLAVIGDDFKDGVSVDFESSTAYVDFTGECVHSGLYITEETTVAGEMDLSKLREGDITVTPLDPNVRRFPGTRDSSVLDMVDEGDQAWMYTVRSPNTMTVGIEVKIDFTNTLLPPATHLVTEKIILDPFVTNNSILVLVQYSQDGRTWKDLPVVDPTRRLVGPTAFLCDRIELTHLRIIMSKEIHDRVESGFVYDFGIRHLGLISYHSVFVEESVLASKECFALDIDGEIQPFSKVALSNVCEHIPAGTRIDYSVAFLMPDGVGGHTQTDFFKLIPLNREDPTGPAIAEVGAATETVHSATIDSTDPAPADFPFMSDRHNRLLETEDAISDSNLEVWRNVGYNDRYYRVRLANGTAIDSGWEIDGPYFVCYGLVDEASGLEIDFGPQPIEIDGAEVAGRTLLSPGIHKFRVHERNWFSVQGLRNVSGLDTTTKRFTGARGKYGDTGLEDDLEETLNYQVIDPLFPYNHKLLIEGLTYSANFTGTKAYKGVSRFAGHLMRRATEAQMGLNTPEDDYSKYCITRVEDSVVPRVMVKWVQYESDDPRELFTIVTSEGDQAEGLVFKATFKTSHPNRTASLDSYELKLI